MPKVRISPILTSEWSKIRGECTLKHVKDKRRTVWKYFLLTIIPTVCAISKCKDYRYNITLIPIPRATKRIRPALVIQRSKSDFFFFFFFFYGLHVICSVRPSRSISDWCWLLSTSAIKWNFWHIWRAAKYAEYRTLYIFYRWKLPMYGRFFFFFSQNTTS